MTIFLLKRKDGSIAVMHLLNAAATVEVELAKWSETDRSAVVSWRQISANLVPADRFFRAAWCDVTPEPCIDIDIAKARDIWRNELREQRIAKLVNLDVAWQRAAESGDADAQKSIVARKQKLRDAPANPAIDNARTCDALRTILLSGIMA